jgi:hypothetical protein
MSKKNAQIQGLKFCSNISTYSFITPRYIQPLRQFNTTNILYLKVETTRILGCYPQTKNTCAIEHVEKRRTSA